MNSSSDQEDSLNDHQLGPSRFRSYNRSSMSQPRNSSPVPSVENSRSEVKRNCASSCCKASCTVSSTSNCTPSCGCDPISNCCTQTKSYVKTCENTCKNHIKHCQYCSGLMKGDKNLAYHVGVIAIVGVTLYILYKYANTHIR